nr:highly reducing polyketide synthase azab [Quercus suber]
MNTSRMQRMIGTETSVYIGCFTRDYEAVSARQSIRAGESSMSIVGGTGLILLPDTMRALTALHFLSPDSKCYSFGKPVSEAKNFLSVLTNVGIDARANGYARGEGIGTIVLKPVTDAIRDGDTIRAVIRGTGSNQDGRSEAQAKLIARTYREAGIPYHKTQYFEGTPAGDPLELAALGATFGQDTSLRAQPLYVGSVKTNIGHLEGCAGLAGLMKAILSVESGYIFPSLNFENPNPRLRLKEWNLEIPTELSPWPTTGTRRVHAIIDDAYHYLKERNLHGYTNTDPSLPITPQPNESNVLGNSVHNIVTQSHVASSLAIPNYRKQIFVLSARDQASLGRLISSYSAYIVGKAQTQGQFTFLQNLAYTLASRRSSFQWRHAAIGATRDEVSRALENAVAVRSKKLIRLCLVFTGQGAQWFEMGRQLMEYEVYASSVQQADSYLKAEGASWSVLEELGACEKGSRINEPEMAQPLSTVLQVALVDLISHWGINPTVVVGHSSGEIGAAYAAGALSSEDAWKIAFHRGRAAKRLSVLRPDLCGSMTVVGISSEDMVIHLQALEPDVKATIACFNSPGNITLSGDIGALQVLEARLDAGNIFNRRLKVTTAYHSYHMEYIVDEYKQSIIDMKPQSIRSGCTFYSTVTGAPVEGSQLDAGYWCSNMTSPVRFSQAVEAILSNGSSKSSLRKNTASFIDTFVEIGPSGALQGPLRQILSSTNCLENRTILSMLSRGKDAIETSLTLMSRLWTLGCSGLDIDRVNSYKAQIPGRQVLVDTPLYPWDHSMRYWHEDRISVRHRHPNAPRLDLLGSPAEDWNPAEPKWRHRLKIGELPWIREHKVQGSLVFPAAGYLCAVIEAARQVADSKKVVKSFELRDVVFGRALTFASETDVIELNTTLKPRKLGLRAKDAPWIECTLYSNNLEDYLEHCSALLQIHYEQEASQLEGGYEERIRNERLSQEYHAVFGQSTKEIEPSELYAKLEGVGLQYGPLFQGMSSIRGGLAGCGCTTITVPSTGEAMPANFEFDHLIHPCTLDACFQSVFVAFTEQSKQRLQAMVPTAIDSIRVSATQPRGAGTKYFGFAKGSKRGFRDAVGSVHMSDHAWSAPLLEIEGFCCTELGGLFGGMVPEQPAISVRKLQSYWRWEADPALLTPQVARKLIQMSEADFETNRNVYASTTVDGEKLSAIFGKSALGLLSQEAKDMLPAHLGSYVDWLQDQYRMAREGALALQYGSPDWVTMSQDEEQAFIAEKEFTSIDATLLTAIGRELTNILEGHISPLSVLMKDNMLFDFYANPVTAAQWEKVFTLFGHKQPDMKILEIGAGTGSSTEPILRALGGPSGSTTRCSKYLFTDISSGFFEPAEKRLKQWSNVVTYKRLDIEMDPLDQGFEAESFDIIIATNVLHATKNIDDTLQNVLRLLKPGGHLIAGEVTCPKARLTMIYGTLPGWWLSEDGRQGGPCMTEQQWIDAFKRNGLHFDYSVWDVPEETIHLMSLFSTTKKTQLQLPFDKVMIVDNGSPSPEVRHLVNMLHDSLLDWGVQSESYHIADVKHPDPAISDGLVKAPAWISLLEIENPFLLNMDEVQFERVQELLLKTSATLWITKGDRLNDCDPNFRLVMKPSLLDLKTLKSDCEVAHWSILSFFQSLFSVDHAALETEAAFHDGKFMIPRLYDDQNKNYDLQMLHKQRLPIMQPVKQAGRPLRLTIGTPGILDSLHFIDDQDAYGELPEDYVEFEDIMVSMGIVPDNAIGCDAAGIVTRTGSKVSDLKPGDRVACITLGAYRNLIRTPGSLLQKLPSQMSFEDAATLPTVYVTAYQSLIEIGRLQAAETVLIHAAAGGVGQAAIQLAKHVGAEIFVTVSSLEKKQLIVDTYGIPKDHIFNSRDLTFADAVMRATNGKGVDVVINSLAGEALRKTWTCMRSFGRFIEVGKKSVKS